MVDADDETAHVLAGRLGRQGHEIDRAGSAQAALERYEQADLVLLDLDLPDLDGVEACRRIRARGGTPIITFTSGTELDRVLTLQAGADDCLVKPYGFRELMARMDAVARRACSSVRPPQVISLGFLHVDPRSRQVRLGDRTVDVTRKEFDLLYMLASAPEMVFSRKELMARVWADDWGMSSRTVDTHVSTLRNKLGNGDWIVTVRGVGYRLGSGAA
ncbi:MAG TPA: response regulator transcription factor [Mycobacteriales bacterium]|nr:response regulator transcription factor [Mycobacteriales bacterium]